jgi:hypothetical protein
MSIKPDGNWNERKQLIRSDRQGEIGAVLHICVCVWLDTWHARGWGHGWDHGKGMIQKLVSSSSYMHTVHGLYFCSRLSPYYSVDRRREWMVVLSTKSMVASGRPTCHSHTAISCHGHWSRRKSQVQVPVPAKARHYFNIVNSFETRD